MNHWLEKLTRPAARLAFWRKRPTTTDATAEGAETPAPTAAKSEAAPPSAPQAAGHGWLARLTQRFKRGTSAPAVDAKAEAPADASAPRSATPPAPMQETASKPSWLQRLKGRLRRAPKPATAAADTPAQESRPPTAADAAATHAADGEAATKPSLLSRLKTRLRRAPKAATGTADTEAQDASPPTAREPASARATDAADAQAEGEAPPRRTVAALLANKRVWIPAVAVSLLGSFGTLGVMLMKSGQENAKLQAKLSATETTLKQQRTQSAKPATPAASDKIVVARQDAAPPKPNPYASAPDTSPGVADVDCVITDKASVTKNLRTCIEAFNQAMGK